MGRVKSILGRRDGLGIGTVGMAGCLKGTLAWRIPGTGESGGLPSMGSHRVGLD